MSDSKNNQDYARLKTLYSISKKLSIFKNVEESFAEVLQCAAESFPLTSAVLIEHWEQKPKTEAWFSENTPELVVGNAVANANSAYSYFSGISQVDEGGVKNIPPPLEKCLFMMKGRFSSISTKAAIILLFL
jgi:hypothetical protein